MQKSQRGKKTVFDVAYLEYKKTDSYKNYMEAKAKLEAKQQLKKNERTQLDGIPKRAPSAYALYRAEVMPGIVEENDGKKDGEKLSVGLIGKKIAEMWVDVDGDRKRKYAEEAERLKAEYDKKLKEFKVKTKYTEYLEKRQKIKARQNIQVNLRDMPKRPKSVFALFADEHKTEVEPGKGEGKGRSALKVLWNSAPEDQKHKYQEMEMKLKEQWMSEVKAFKESTPYLTFEVTKRKVIQEFQNEAVKITTMKFLSESPEPPPKTAFAVFLHEKRRKLSHEKRGRAAMQEEVKEAKTEWIKMDRVVRSEYEVKRKEELANFEGEVKAFMASEKWQEYVKEAKRLRIPVRSLLYHKKKIMKKIKGPASIPLPRRPELFPNKPKSAMQIFTAEKKKEIESIAEIGSMWTELDPEEKARYNELAQKEFQEFDRDMREFKQSDDGKSYFRDLRSAQRRRRILGARLKYLTDMPKKPRAAVVVWMKEKAPQVKRENPDAKGFELRKILFDKWGQLDESERDPYETSANEKRKEFEETMMAFKKSDNWMNFVRATKAKAKAKGSKGGGKGLGSGPRKPEEMPTKPVNAFQTYCQEQAGSGKGLRDLQVAFSSLPDEEKQSRLQQADAQMQKYQEELADFDKSEIGKKYNKALANFKKQTALSIAKKRFLKDEPKKPPNAYFLFAQEQRPKIMDEFPDVKGLGPIGQKVGEAWTKLSPEDKQVWLDKEKELKSEWEEKFVEFQKSPNYKKYQAVMKRVSGKPSTSGKGKAKGKNVITGPAKPANLPKKPPASFFLFCSEKRRDGAPGGIKALNDAWIQLGADGQKEYNEKVAEMNRQYELDMKEFTKSVEGKKYLREKAQAEKKQRLVKAKEKYLGKAPQEPKRPPSAYFIFVQDNRQKVATEAGKGGVGEVAKELTAVWSKLEPDEKREYEERADKLKAEYDKELAAWKGSPQYKAYARAVDSINGKKAAKAKAAAKAAARKGAGKGRAAAKAAAGGGQDQDSDSDSDAMGSDSDDSSSKSKSDSDSD